MRTKLRNTKTNDEFFSDIYMEEITNMVSIGSENIENKTGNFKPVCKNIDCPYEFWEINIKEQEGMIKVFAYSNNGTFVFEVINAPKDVVDYFQNKKMINRIEKQQEQEYKRSQMYNY